MRNLQLRRPNRLVTVSRMSMSKSRGPFANSFLLSELRFDSAQRMQQIERRTRSLRFRRAVQKPRLIQIIDRLGFITRRRLSQRTRQHRAAYQFAARRFASRSPDWSRAKDRPYDSPWTFSITAQCIGSRGQRDSRKGTPTFRIRRWLDHSDRDRCGRFFC